MIKTKQKDANKKKLKKTGKQFDNRRNIHQKIMEFVRQVKNHVFFTGIELKEDILVAIINRHIHEVHRVCG